MAHRWSGATRVLIVLCFGVVLQSHSVAQVSNATERGVVVEEIGAHSAVKIAGLEVGDVLLAWTRESMPPAKPAAASGSIESPFDLSEVEMEQAPRGRVTLIGTRGRQPARWTLPPGPWGVQVRPLSVDGPGWIVPWQLLKAASQLVEARQGTEVDAAYARAVDEANRAPHYVAAQLLNHWGASLRIRNDRVRAKACFERSLALRRSTTPHSIAAAATLASLGDLEADRRDFSAAEKLYREALDIAREQAPESLQTATILHKLGRATLRKPTVAIAAEFHERAYAIREKLAPESLAFAQSLNALGQVAAERGDLTTSADFARRALAIQERLAPGGLEVAGSLNDLGVVEGRRNNLAAAETFFRQALAIEEKLAPESHELATSLSNLGGVYQLRRDPTTMREFFRRALAIREKLAPGTREIAVHLNGLTIAAMLSGDFAEAEDHAKRALGIQESIDPNSVDVAGSLTNLGSIATVRGDLRAADDLYLRALKIYQKSAPLDPQIAQILSGTATVALIRSHFPTGEDAQQRAELTSAEELLRGMVTVAEQFAPRSMTVAEALYTLGITARFRGDLAAATDLNKRALAIVENLAPQSMLTALVLSELASAASRRSEIAEAERYIARALAILDTRTEPTWIEGSALNQLALANGRVRNTAAAARLHEQAIDAVEQQEGNLGAAGDARALFSTLTASFYREAVEAQVAIGRLADGLYTLERSRARTLLRMLAERDLRFTADLPPEIARERALNATEYDAVLWKIARLDPVRDKGQLTDLQARVQALRDDRERLTAQLRQASPKYAALRYPEPLDLSGVRETLDPGTVLLSYSVGKDKTLLFVVRSANETSGPSGVEVLDVPIGDRQLREEVATFRRAIQPTTLVRGLRRVPASPQSHLHRQAGSLYDLLIRPAERLIASSKRVLISPDGPLHGLPFAALVRNHASGRPTYFIEWKPLHVVASATLYAQLRRERNTRASGNESSLVAFGDPLYPAATGENADALRDAAVRFTVRRGNGLPLLPATGREVRAIAELYGPAAQVFVKGEATEERAKNVGRASRYLHFASHGVLDQRFPLNSGLALTIPDEPVPGQENGLLQAWEVFDHLRIDADLVTLSACETGLGAEMGGEGLVGLVRAFQYAGARSVAASLWSVADESTATLMTKFYTALKAGKWKDEALRSAQLALLRDKRTASPFYWAAFQLYGDWR